MASRAQDVVKAETTTTAQGIVKVDTVASPLAQLSPKAIDAIVEQMNADAEDEIDWIKYVTHRL